MPYVFQKLPTSGNVYSPGIRMTGIIGGVIGSVKWGILIVEDGHSFILIFLQVFLINWLRSLICSC